MEKDAVLQLIEEAARNKKPEFNLSDKLLTSLPPEIKELKNLRWLDLSHNRLTSLPPEIKELKNLRRLDLYRNQLTSFPPEIKELKSLRSLDLSNNQLKSLPFEILGLGLEIKYEFIPEVTKLELGFDGINLGNNPLVSPPIEIVKKGRDAIEAYFKSLEGEKQPLNEVKVLLVGEGGAGKTSLVKKLRGKQFDEKEQSTPGINIRHWEVKDGTDTIKVHFWDFGGQEIMHATHQFFLSKRSLYILVLDGTREEKTEYWLKHIESFGGNSPVLVVLNKIDENPLYDLNRSSLLEKYQGIKGFYRISCKNGEGFEDFKKNLGKELTHIELRHYPFAKNWFNVKTQLENMHGNFISYDEYMEMCMKENITDKSAQDTLIGFLNDLGVILHFKEFTLKYTHVLEPNWVTGTVYKIINSKELAKNKGVLKLILLDEILKQEKDTDFYYPPDKYNYIIDLMEKFELCYKIDTQTILLPNLLQEDEPNFDFEKANSLKFHFEYDFLPKSVMSRFIVKRHKDIKNELQWRTGVVLEDDAFHSTAVIKADEATKKISIYVNGGQKRDYFSTIRKTFREINASFEKLEIKELVPLPDNEKNAIEYEELIGHYLIGRDEYFSGKLLKVYSVKKLLDGIEKEEEYIKKSNYTVIKGDVIMEDVFKNIQNATIINKSVVENSFNKVKKEHDEEVAKALVRIAEFIEKSGDINAATLFDKFNEELNKSIAEKSTLRKIWGGIEKTLPSIATISEVVAKLAPLF